MRDKSNVQDFVDTHRLRADRDLLDHASYSCGRFVILREQRKKISSKMRKPTRKRLYPGDALTMGEFIDAVEQWENETGWDIGQDTCKYCGEPSTRFHTFLKNVTVCDDCE